MNRDDDDIGERKKNKWEKKGRENLLLLRQRRSNCFRQRHSRRDKTRGGGVGMRTPSSLGGGALGMGGRGRGGEEFGKEGGKEWRRMLRKRGK